MSELEIKEAIKAFAFGFSVERVAEECEISLERAKEIQKNCAKEIEERRKASYE